MKRLFISVLVTLSSGCAVHSTYQRPVVQVPGSPYPSSGSDGPSFGDLAWFEVFHDDGLTDLLRVAISSNIDVKTAANRVLQAQQEVRIARATQLPAVGVSLGLQRSSENVGAAALGIAQVAGSSVVSGTASWKPDIWRLFGSQVEVLRAKSAAATEYKHVVTQSLVTTLAQTYIDLIEHDSELEISHRALASFQDSLRIMRIKEEYGVAAPVDVKQAEQLVQTASHSIPLIEQQIVQNEDAINYLLGRNPGITIRRGDSLQNQKLSAAVPAGLPAALLNRRPDIRLAEQLLIAASAHVGMARASLFPNIALTASGGSISTALSLLLVPGAGFWILGGSLTQPIFDGGELRARYRLTQLQKDELVMTYAQTVQGGFREVADALAKVDHARQALLEQEALAKTAAEQAELSNIRYRNGLTKFLEALDSERTHFASQQGLSQARRDQSLAVISLYGALGGGWEQ